MHELVNERSKSEAAASNICRLKTNSLRSTTTTDESGAASGITVNVDKIGHSSKLHMFDERQASVVIDVLSCATDLINLSGVCKC